MNITEAPETMGTALKTIIARMRELSDYGATLEGDTDVNNVESQLAYVGIALRDANGELRSTEDVLDELGRKWDTLNSNQQAALAKALAGTRWRTRLWRVQRSAKNYLSKSSWIVGTTLKASLLTIGGNIQWGKRNDLDIVKRWSI